MRIIIGLMGLLLAMPVQAAEWTAVQGDIVKVSLNGVYDVRSVRALRKTWPLQQVAAQQWQAWIGVDLKKKPKDYALTWKTSGADVRDTLHVQKGVFRISRIEVPKKMSNFDSKAVHRIRADQAAIAACYDMALPFQADFTSIVPPVHGIESTPFGAQRYVNGQPRSPHAGIDIATPKGTPVFAPMAGKVLLVQSMFLNGNLIALGHGSGVVTVYAHLSHFDVHEGEMVQAGQKIGEVGSTGRSTGAHLHWGLRFQHARVNPHALLKLAGVDVR